MKKPEEDIERIHKVVKYIEQHLDQDLPLDNLAEIACYSPFHFQRIFKEIIGETPKQYIKRIRLESAAHFIVLFPDKSIFEIALQVGFKSLEAFSRAFKDYYLISPDFFKKSGEVEKIKIIQNPKLSKKFLNSPTAFLPSAINHAEFADLKIEILKQTAQKLVYIQSNLADLQGISRNFKIIKQWVETRELAQNGLKLFGLIRDYPLFTPLDKCRYLVCASVDKLPDLNGIISFMEFPATTTASFQVSGGIAEIIKIISYLVHFWLPNHGYQLHPRPVIQIPLLDPIQIPFDQNTHQIFIHIQPA